MKGRFRQLLKIYFHSVERASKFIMSCCVLHNMCIDNNDPLEDIINEINDDCDVSQDHNLDHNSRAQGERKRNLICNNFE